MKEGRGEDDEEEAYGEDLAKLAVGGFQTLEEEGGSEKRVDRRRVKHTKDKAMIVLRPAAILSVCSRALAGALITLGPKSCAGQEAVGSGMVAQCLEARVLSCRV